MSINIQRLESINLETLEPFNDFKKQWDNVVAEINGGVEIVMEHYGLFLYEGDYEYGRERQFHAPDIKEAIALQERITRDSWFRTKTFAYGSAESIYLWRRHKIEYAILVEMLK